MFDRFTARSKTAFRLACQAAQRLDHAYLGTEHLLLGLVEEGGGVAAGVLRALQVEPSQVRAELGRFLRPGSSQAAGQLPFTPGSQKVLELTLEEAALLGHASIGTGHFLLALLREGEGLAAMVLRGKLGLTTEELRAELAAFVETNPDADEGADPDPGADEGAG